MRGAETQGFLNRPRYATGVRGCQRCKRKIVTQCCLEKKVVAFQQIIGSVISAGLSPESRASRKASSATENQRTPRLLRWVTSVRKLLLQL